MGILNEAKGRLLEVLTLEAPSSWFERYYVPESNRPQEPHVRMTDAFLQSHQGRMKKTWELFEDTMLKIETMEALGEKVDQRYLDQKSKTSIEIRSLCGLKGETIYTKLKYLRQNNGIDSHGRTITTARE